MPNTNDVQIDIGDLMKRFERAIKRDQTLILEGSELRAVGHVVQTHTDEVASDALPTGPGGSALIPGSNPS